jgi:hypothetical protein
MAVAVAAAGTAAHANLPSSPDALMNSTFDGEWGILPGLSVFAEGSRQAETDVFALTGLRLYFAQVGNECRDSSGKKLANCPPIYLGS